MRGISKRQNVNVSRTAYLLEEHRVFTCICLLHVCMSSTSSSLYNYSKTVKFSLSLHNVTIRQLLIIIKILVYSRLKEFIFALEYLS